MSPAASSRRMRDAHGPKALAGFGSAKGSNEEAYLFQKLVRTGFRSNNVDHCTRLCHASSVVALLEGIGSGAVSNPVMDVTQAEVVILIGANPTVNHPVAATWIKNAAKAGTKLIVMDPRRSELSRVAHRFLQFKPDTDVAMLNALMHVIVTEGLVDADFIASRTIGYDELRKNVEGYSPEAMAPICGIDAATLREVARLYARSKASMILWGMGVSQHVHGTDNARCLIALALMTGQIGRPGTGLHPLRGQNNVQGASDAGLIPMMLPDYQHVSKPEVRARFEQAWQLAPGSLDDQAGPDGRRGDGSDPRRRRARHVRDGREPGDVGSRRQPCARRAGRARAPGRAGHLPDRDRLPGRRHPAGQRLPREDRQLHQHRPPGADRPPGGRPARRCAAGPVDHPAACQPARTAVGLRATCREVFDEMRHTMPSIGGITWERLEREHAVTYPCLLEGDPGQSVVFTEDFPREGGRARFVPADIIPAAERPDAEYPLVLITGRQLEHWHTGSMTRRAAVLDAIEPDPTALVHPLDLDALGIEPGDVMTIESRRGRVALYARADDGMPRGAVFVPFCYYEAAINTLTNAALDPFAKIPEFKYCAVRVSAGGVAPHQSSYGGGQIIERMTS